MSTQMFCSAMLCLSLLSHPIPSHANSVDTRQFGLLALGTSAQQVRANLGEPDAIRAHTDYACVRTGRGANTCHPVTIQEWYYDGGSTLMHTYLLFYNGVLRQKDKRR